jgi:hypothetical protein
MHGSLQTRRLWMAGSSPLRGTTSSDSSLKWRARCWLDETDGQPVGRTEEVIEDVGCGWGWRAWRWRE